MNNPRFAVIGLEKFVARRGKSFYTESSGPDEKALRRGMRWLVENAKLKGGKGLIAVHALQNLKHLSWSSLSEIFDSLAEHRVVRTNEISLELLTVRDKNVSQFDGPILVPFGGPKVLDIVDGVDGSADVLLIPWIREEAQAWIDTWRATELDGVETGKAGTSMPSVVARALEGLTDQVNLATGIINSSDRQTAILVLETLRHKSAETSPEAIRQELVRLGWNPSYAREVKLLAEKIWQEGRPKGSTGKADERLWNYWLEKLGD